MGSTPQNQEQNFSYGGMGNQYSAPNWWVPSQGQQSSQGLWQNPFSPMTSADWAALREQYYPAPTPPPPPAIGTLEHAQQMAGGPIHVKNTGTREYANYMQAMATLYGTPVTMTEQFAGEGEAGSQYKAYEYQGKTYKPSMDALNWASNLAQQHGGIGPGQAESLFGPAPNPAFTQSIQGWFQENFPSISYMFDISHPAWGGGRGALGVGGYADFDAPGQRGPAQGYGFEGGDPAHDE